MTGIPNSFSSSSRSHSHLFSICSSGGNSILEHFFLFLPLSLLNPKLICLIFLFPTHSCTPTQIVYKETTIVELWMESSAIFSLNGFTLQTNQDRERERKRTKEKKEVLEKKFLEKRTGWKLTHSFFLFHFEVESLNLSHFLSGKNSVSLSLSYLTAQHFQHMNMILILLYSSFSVRSCKNCFLSTPISCHISYYSFPFFTFWSSRVSKGAEICGEGMENMKMDETKNQTWNPGWK